MMTINGIVFKRMNDDNDHWSRMMCLRLEWNCFHMHFRAALPPPTGAIKWCDQIMRSNDAIKWCDDNLRWIIKWFDQTNHSMRSMLHQHGTLLIFNSKSFNNAETPHPMRFNMRPRLSHYLTDSSSMHAKEFSSNTSIWFHPNFPMDFPKQHRENLIDIIIVTSNLHPAIKREFIIRSCDQTIRLIATVPFKPLYF